MKKIAFKIVSILLVATFLFTTGISAFAVENESANDYKIVSPYKDVNWGVTQEYKGNLHTHSTFSDASENLVDTLLEHYEQGFDFVAMTDHGVTGVAWNKKPYQRLLYSYQHLIGLKQNCLTDEQFAAVLDGSYPLKSTGEARGRGMVCVTGGNELNALTASKSHVNGIFLPSNFGNTNLGFENGYRFAVNQIDEQGGLSFINHPGDWLKTNDDMNNVYDEDKLKYFTEIFMDYDTCLGMEVFNEKNGTTGYDRILWDNMLMYALPYGKTIIGYANTDAHEPDTVDTSFMTFMMAENNVENIKATMMNGAFFSTTKCLRANEFEIGPAVAIEADNKGLDYPMFTKVAVDGHKITVNAENADTLQWIANGKVIYKGEITDGTYTLDLDTIEGAEDFLYVRAEIISEGGITVTQALTIDNGEEALEFSEKTKNFIESFIERFTSSLLYVLIQELIRAI